ncbi:tetratricopeptide repeat protein [Thermospira aquatica]|uniref:Tetratricopeptide repeat protein n=1 Tax=Thermospira aquatica TaxID=2828656 RepID=A0AAX3BFJ6_9SPIR|nr:tetratricopeptide repeat protein [Thermospira aquatica]URA11060.1 tetratricopeptide repeat protein [Thermospira aquatica]
MNVKKYFPFVAFFLVGFVGGFFLGMAQNPVTSAIRKAEKLAASQKLEDKKNALESLSQQKELIRLATINARIENARKLVAFSLADRLIVQRMWFEAARYLEIAQDITPASAAVAYRQGLVYYNLAFAATNLSMQDAYLKKADERLRFVLKQEPENPDALYLLALMALQRKDAREAYQYLSIAYKVNPKNVDILFALARVYYELGDYEQAKKVYGKLQSILPKNDSRWDTVEKNLQLLQQR